MIASRVQALSLMIGGQPQASQSQGWAEIFDPSTGGVIAHASMCTAAEVDAAVQSCKAAFPAWSGTPALKRVQTLYRFRDLIDRHLDELTHMVCREHGKVWEEAQGDVLKAKEIVEF